MAKVLVSVPDELLERVDARAKELGESRSGYLRGLAERDLDDLTRRQAEVRRLLDLILNDVEGDEPMPDAAQMIREDRDSR